VKRIFLPLAGIAATLILAGCVEGDAGSDPTSSSTTGQTSSKVRATTVPIAGGATIDRIDSRLRGTSGPVDVWVSLDQDSIAAAQAKLAKASPGTTGRKVSPSNVATFKTAAADQRSKIVTQQARTGEMLMGLGAEELGRVQVAHNAIAVRVDASQLQQIALVPGVKAVRPVINYELDLSETVPYVGGSAVQTAGVDGAGVKVAVLDSGIDYTHRNLGGDGTLEAYEAAYGVSPADPKNTTRDGLFPTAKVVDGYDFVGEAWPNAARTEDEDPIDFEGHGTHVADIIAGRSADGTHKGMAPGASLVAVKTCSAVSSSCNGVALLLGIDFALDPDGDDDLSDAVDVINMSLGSPYGQVEDDLSLAAANAVELGVVVVASAGNSANKPYVTGSPASTAGVISVAQTQVPSATAIPLVVNSPAPIAGVYGNTATLSFAPVGNGVIGDVVYVGRGCPAGSVNGTNPDDPYLAVPSGKIALIDRGGCSVSLKVDRATEAGATGVLIGLVAPGDAVSFSFGGGDAFVPSLVIQQSLSGAIKARLAAAEIVNASISNAAAINLEGSMASSSSRGPAMGTALIKPEIGAPGESLSAEVGTGNGETAFGGTSGAAPMVAGAAALMIQAHPNRSVAQIKAMLMNSAERTVYTSPAVVPGELAPITRIGAGELRVDRAVKLKAAAWNVEAKSAALSFGAVEVPIVTVLKKRVRVENFGLQHRNFKVTPTFRYAEDESSGAVRVVAQPFVNVAPGGAAEFDVLLVIEPRKLPSWTLNGGSRGGDGAGLNGPEYDGYITLTAGSERLSLPWHVLPRKASLTTSIFGRHRGSDAIWLTNLGRELGEYDVFSLIGTSPRIPREELPGPGDNFAVINIKSVGVRFLPASVAGIDVLEFAINTFGRRSHPNYPAGFEIYLDTNGDGQDDYLIFNSELSGFAATGQNGVFVAKLPATSGTGVFFADADLNSGNIILTVPVDVSGVATPPRGYVGVTLGTTIGVSAYVYDNYFTGIYTDQILDMRFKVGSPRFSAAEPFGSVPSFSRSPVPLVKANVPPADSSETGVLVMYRRNALIEAEAVPVR
jgi:minor extracellular serine protease Vpr